MIRRVDENWCEGELNGKKGIFPVTFVEVSAFVGVMLISFNSMTQAGLDRFWLTKNDNSFC